MSYRGAAPPAPLNDNPFEVSDASILLLSNLLRLTYHLLNAFPSPLEFLDTQEPAFLEGLEAAGYLQRLDTSEARITARYQHALTKMRFAAHSEEFLTRAGVRKVHGSTVQFFNETPVSDPFVHVMVGSLPPSKQALVTPVGCPTSGWTPIGSPDEADGTIHFTVSHAGFWPLTVVFDMNPQDLPIEDRYRTAESESDPEAEFYADRRRNRGEPSRRSSRAALEEDSTSDSDDGGYGGNTMRGGRRESAYGRTASRANSMAASTSARSAGAGGRARSNSRSGSTRY
ncbi:hypothetical protein RQP46_003075 [Phenoliferia psychrophenolica]